jgi:hypothetical protein
LDKRPRIPQRQSTSLLPTTGAATEGCTSESSGDNGPVVLPSPTCCMDCMNCKDFWSAPLRRRAVIQQRCPRWRLRAECQLHRRPRRNPFRDPAEEHFSLPRIRSKRNNNNNNNKRAISSASTFAIRQASVWAPATSRPRARPSCSGSNAREIDRNFTRLNTVAPMKRA